MIIKLLWCSGSNEFAGSGANPIWQAAMENDEYNEDDLQFLEEMSDYSGDSILIGVEDQTEFNDYREKVEEVSSGRIIFDGKTSSGFYTIQPRLEDIEKCATDDVAYPYYNSTTKKV